MDALIEIVVEALVRILTLQPNPLLILTVGQGPDGGQNICAHLRELHFVHGWSQLLHGGHHAQIWAAACSHHPSPPLTIRPNHSSTDAAVEAKHRAISAIQSDTFVWLAWKGLRQAISNDQSSGWCHVKCPSPWWAMLMSSRLIVALRTTARRPRGQTAQSG